MSAPAKANEIDPLLHPAQVAKLLGVSLSWLAKSRLTGTGPRCAALMAAGPCGTAQGWALKLA
jgi:hypothetical protein